MEIFHSLSDFGNFSWQYGDDKDQSAREAFRSVMLVTGDPKIYDIPSEQMMEQWKQQSFDRFGYRYAKDEQVDVVPHSLVY